MWSCGTTSRRGFLVVLPSAVRHDSHENAARTERIMKDLDNNNGSSLLLLFTFTPATTARNPLDLYDNRLNSPSRGRKPPRDEIRPKNQQETQTPYLYV